jgi:hypothetical protein
MPVELKGQQIRIRVRNPKLFSKFRVLDVGKKGRLQAIIGKLKNKDKWVIQSWRLNLATYKNWQDAESDLGPLYVKGDITYMQYASALELMKKWFSGKK